MNLFTMLFADPTQPLASARIAANTKADACALMDAYLGTSLTAPSTDGFALLPGIVLTWMGEMDVQMPAVLSVVKRVVA